MFSVSKELACTSSSVTAPSLLLPNTTSLAPFNTAPVALTEVPIALAVFPKPCGTAFIVPDKPPPNPPTVPATNASDVSNLLKS